MRAHESFNGAPAPATGISVSSGQFTLLGGKYWFGAVGNFSSGTFTLQRIGPDNSTPINVATALTSNGGNVSDLPPGTYQVTITSSTTAAVYWEVVRVPEE